MSTRSPAARYAYRRFDKTEALPLVFCTRFRATIDHMIHVDGGRVAV
jgi:hypothetical protein